MRVMGSLRIAANTSKLIMQSNSDDVYIKWHKTQFEYLLYKLVNPTPVVLYFGAGASYGSDNSRLVKRRQLPPIGKDLYDHLSLNPSTKYWKEIPAELQPIFRENFELGLKEIMDNDREYKIFYKLLFELGLYFSKFKPEKSNLYTKLADKIYKQQTDLSIITLNYDPLLQYALKNTYIFPNSVGVQQYDIEGNLPKQKIDVIYPHGACQFVYRLAKNGEEEIFTDRAEVIGSGLFQYFVENNIKNSYEKTEGHVRPLPIMCAYEPDKRPFAKNDFIDFQQRYYEQTIKLAKRIIIVGVNCNYEKDRHLWQTMEETNAEIIFVEPSEDGRKRIEQWGNPNVQIISKNFAEAFDEICKLAYLN